MATMKEILAAAAQGQYAEVDGVGTVIEEIFRDFAELQATHERFLRKYGHVVQRRPLEATATPAQHQTTPQQPPPPRPVSPPQGHYPPPPYVGAANGQQIYDDRYPLSPANLTPEAAEELENSVQDLARRLVRTRTRPA